MAPPPIVSFGTSNNRDFYRDQDVFFVCDPFPFSHGSMFLRYEKLLQLYPCVDSEILERDIHELTLCRDARIPRFDGEFCLFKHEDLMDAGRFNDVWTNCIVAEKVVRCVSLKGVPKQCALGLRLIAL